MSKKVLFVGPGRSGKDTACGMFAEITGLKDAGTTSLALTRYVARKLGIPDSEAYARRHESDAMRVLWFETGNAIRENDPSLLVREMLTRGDITGGVRGRPEIESVRREGLVDLIVWIDRNVPVDPTMEYGADMADVVIKNHGTLDDLRSKLLRLAVFAGLTSQGEK